LKKIKEKKTKNRKEKKESSEEKEKIVVSEEEKHDKKGKKKKNKKKGKEKPKKDGVKFGLDGSPGTFSCMPEDATFEKLSEEFQMSIIKYLVSDDHDCIFQQSGGHYPVVLGRSYVVVGIVNGNDLCGRCNKEYNIEKNSITSTCRFHAGKWRDISIMVKEYEEDPDTHKRKKVLKEKLVKGWTCCAATQINMRGCTKVGGHTHNSDRILSEEEPVQQLEASETENEEKPTKGKKNKGGDSENNDSDNKESSEEKGKKTKKKVKDDSEKDSNEEKNDSEEKRKENQKERKRRSTRF